MIRSLFVFWLSLGAPVAYTQTPQPTVSAAVSTGAGSSTQQAVDTALLGEWTGVLSYRDYAEPAGSDKRVLLPTWLSIQRQPEGLRLRYVYDDGPSKTVRNESTLVLDATAATYRIIGTDEVAERYAVSGLDRLQQGHGELLLTGAGTESGKAVEVREHLRLRRNLLSWVRETRPAGTTEPFTFRHEYTFVRSLPPAPAAGR